MESIEIKTALDGIKKVIDERVDAIELKNREHDDEILQLKQHRSAMPNEGAAPRRESKRFETINGHQVKWYGRDDLLAKSINTAADDFSLGQFVRDNVLGTKAASSTAVVPTGVSSTVIDRVRAKTVVIEAGSGTIVIDGPANAARLTGDPSVIEHVESAADVTESDVTFEALALNPKTLICSVPLSLEVVADSPNLDDVINTALAGAFSAKVDALAIAKILADTGVPTSSASQSCATWAGVLAAVTQALGVNQGLPTANIGNTADFAARAGQLASTAGTWLGAPPALAAMRDLFTTGLTAGTGIFGDFAAALAIAMRQELTVEVVRFGKPGSGSHLLIAHMRAAPVVLQPGKLFIQKSTVI